MVLDGVCSSVPRPTRTGPCISPAGVRPRPWPAVRAWVRSGGFGSG